MSFIKKQKHLDVFFENNKKKDRLSKNKKFININK